jgi:hypothetical protein
VRGGIGANDAGGNFRFGKNVKAGAATIAGDHVGVGEGTSVGNVLGNTVRLGPGVVVGGTVGTPGSLPLVEPFCEIPAFECGGSNVTVPIGDSLTLPPGTYGSLTVLRAATLTLSPGTYQFCSLKTAAGAAIVVTGSDATTIEVTGTLRLSNASSLARADEGPRPTINVSGSYMRVSQGALLDAFVVAPNALLTLGRESTLIGTFCVSTSHSDKHVHLDCPPNSPSGAFLDRLP